MEKQFNIGDMVCLIEDYEGFKAGSVGTVIETDHDPNPKSVLYYLDMMKGGRIEGVYGRRLRPASTEDVIGSKSKFKVGDKVRAIDNRYYYTRVDYGWTGEVVEVNRTGQFMAKTLSGNYSHDGETYYNLNPKHFELIHDQELHITVNGNETIAVYKHDGRTEKAVAKCSPEDKFDFKVGAKIALERLGVLPTEPTVTEKPMRLEFYSPHRELGVCGTPTKYTDAHGTPLFVGDVVEHFADNRSFGETVITDDGKQFVMGIRSQCNNETGEIKGWTIIKKKSFSDMKRGDTVFHDEVQYV